MPHSHAKRYKPKCLSVELHRFVNRMFENRHRKSPEVDSMFDDLSRFQCCCLEIEKSSREDAIRGVKLAIKATYQMIHGSRSFYHHLMSFGLTASELDVRVVREVDKLSNYWKISHDLARICTGSRYRSCRPLFNHITLNRVSPHDPVLSANMLVRSKRFVHAEIQMVMYHETNGPKGLPRVIGSSKAACYLCDAFIKAHSVFRISKAHRQVYAKWTVPQPSQLHAHTLDRLRIALEQVDKEVRQELSLAQRRSPGKLYPFQSSINLHNTVVSTSSDSTFLSQLQSHDGYGPDVCQAMLSTSVARNADTESVSPQLPVPGPQRKKDIEQNAMSEVAGRLSYSHQEESRSLSDQEKSIRHGETAFKHVPIESAIESSSDNLASVRAGLSGEDTSCEVRSSSPRELRVGPFYLYVYLEESPEDIKAYTHASIRAKYLPLGSGHGDQASRAIVLAPGEERVLLCRDYAGAQRPQIMIGDDHCGAVTISCKWHHAIVERT